MTYHTLTALVVRLAGFALLIKIFDFIGAYFIGIYMSTQVLLSDRYEEMGATFDKMYISMAILFFLHLALSVWLIFKANWIASKLSRNSEEVSIDLNAGSVMRLIVTTIGLLFCAWSIYNLQSFVESVMFISRPLTWDEKSDSIRFLISFFLKTGVGLLFLLKARQIGTRLSKRIE